MYHGRYYHNFGIELCYSKLVKDSGNVIDIKAMFNACAKEKNVLPVFVIKDPQEAPLCGEEIAACVTVKINEMCRHFNGLYDHKNFALPKPTVQGAKESKSETSMLLYSVIVKISPTLLVLKGVYRQLVSYSGLNRLCVAET